VAPPWRIEVSIVGTEQSWALGKGFHDEVLDASRPPADEAIVAGGLLSQQLPF
jgi:hypothetical protein